MSTFSLCNRRHNRNPHPGCADCFLKKSNYFADASFLTLNDNLLLTKDNF